MNKDGKFRTLNPGKFWLFASATLALLAGSTAVQAEELLMSDLNSNTSHIQDAKDMKNFYYEGSEFNSNEQGIIQNFEATFWGSSSDYKKKPLSAEHNIAEYYKDPEKRETSDFFFNGDFLNIDEHGNFKRPDAILNQKNSKTTDTEKPQFVNKSTAESSTELYREYHSVELMITEKKFNIKDSAGNSIQTNNNMTSPQKVITDSNGEKYVLISQSGNDLVYRSLEKAGRFEKTWLSAAILEAIETLSKEVNHNEDQLLNYKSTLEEARSCYLDLAKNNNSLLEKYYFQSKTIREKLTKATKDFKNVK